MSEGLTGFIAFDENGQELVKEKNDFYDEGLKKLCATNWHQVSKSKILQLSIWWHGRLLKIFERDLPPNQWEWLFYHTGFFDSKTNSTTTLSRTIGYRIKEKTVLFTVDEKTGFSKREQI